MKETESPYKRRIIEDFIYVFYEGCKDTLTFYRISKQKLSIGQFSHFGSSSVEVRTLAFQKV